jgi:hypothetical protein
MLRPNAAPRFRYVWPTVASLLALIPFSGGFSTTDVFYVRDLANYFWPKHLWHRQTIRAGDWPWWDPYVGGGQSAVADALNQFFFFPVTAVRLAAPQVVGFNFWIAAPFPVLAIGVWFWLRRHVSPAAAFLGAALTPLAGPVLSTGNFPNYSWAVAFVPWILWAVDRLCDGRNVRRFAALAGFAGLQSLAGEPVTFASTSALSIGYAAVAVRAGTWREWTARILTIGGAIAAGVLLSAVQLIPLSYAVSRSMRADDIDPAFWSLHPLALLETVVPHLFGHVYYADLGTFPWIKAMNSGREPLFYSIYVGVGTLALALLGKTGPAMRRWRIFWWAVCGVALLGAFGPYTPVYPTLQDIAPFLKTFRFPVKYLVVSVFALVALTAAGVDSLFAHSRGVQPMKAPRAAWWVLGILGVVSLLVGIGGVVRADWLASLWTAAARILELRDPAAAVVWVVNSGTPVWLRLAAMAILLALLLALVWRLHRLAPLAAWIIYLVALVDPLAVNYDLHPTLPASVLGPPVWVPMTRAHPEDRVYIGGRMGLSATGEERLHAPASVPVPIEWDFREAMAKVGIQAAQTPAAWGIREVISYDLPQLWPREYTKMLRLFRDVPQEDRLRFLRRTGVRYCFQSEPPYPGATLLLAPDFTDPIALYECYDRPLRVYVTGASRIEPSVHRQLELMFDEHHDPFRTVLLERDPPAAAGEAGTPAATASARIVRERNSELVIQVDTGVSGEYLNVVDSYDPFWIVDVDGIHAPLLRANGLFRAVRLAPGRHEVRFRYRPTPFYVGLAVSLVTAFMLLLACGGTAQRRQE